ncbi:MAG: hypothetical protein F6K14_28870 [Symploca sp. SIO2C1]|nr:hypothetical protein [Symploca sp. SIO2C1]
MYAYKLYKPNVGWVERSLGEIEAHSPRTNKRNPTQQPKGKLGEAFLPIN